MCQRENFAQQRNNTNDKSKLAFKDLEEEESPDIEANRPSFSSSIARPIFSASEVGTDGNACLFRFMAESVEAAYRLLYDILGPLQVDIGVRPYQDRIHSSIT